MKHLKKITAAVLSAVMITTTGITTFAEEMIPEETTENITEEADTTVTESSTEVSSEPEAETEEETEENSQEETVKEQSETEAATKSTVLEGETTEATKGFVTEPETLTDKETEAETVTYARHNKKVPGGSPYSAVSLASGKRYTGNFIQMATNIICTKITVPKTGYVDVKISKPMNGTKALPVCIGLTDEDISIDAYEKGKIEFKHGWEVHLLKDTKTRSFRLGLLEGTYYFYAAVSDAEKKLYGHDSDVTISYTFTEDPYFVPISAFGKCEFNQVPDREYNTVYKGTLTHYIENQSPCVYPAGWTEGSLRDFSIPGKKDINYTTAVLCDHTGTYFGTDNWWYNKYGLISANLKAGKVKKIQFIPTEDLYNHKLTLIYTDEESPDVKINYRVVIYPTPLKPYRFTFSSTKDSVTLNWKKAPRVHGYKIYRSTSKNGKYKLVKVIKKNSTLSYTDKKVKAGKTYYYKVRSYVKFKGHTVKGLERAYSKYTSAIKTVTRPCRTKVSGIKKEFMTLTVKAGAVAADGYQVYLGTDKTFKAKKIRTSATNTGITFKNVLPGKKYVKVRAYKTVNGKKYYGSWSKVKSVDM